MIYEPNRHKGLDTGCSFKLHLFGCYCSRILQEMERMRNRLDRFLDTQSNSVGGRG
jgi:hypothetical protein